MNYDYGFNDVGGLKEYILKNRHLYDCCLAGKCKVYVCGDHLDINIFSQTEPEDENGFEFWFYVSNKNIIGLPRDDDDVVFLHITDFFPNAEIKKKVPGTPGKWTWM